jgi:hypothetical protein
LKQRVEDLMSREMVNFDSTNLGTTGLQSINSMTLSNTLMAICDERIEAKKGPLFTFCLAELTKRSDLYYEDIRRIAYACCMKDNGSTK